jgi:hypothetical protein|tara:strand:+ start:207 stop:488 length:282 start_codon:yes stop_codon:yes gene_type:complete
MHLTELLDSPVVEAKLVWARKGKQLTRKFRCTVGKRAGRVVSKPSQCSAPIDLKKRFTLKRTKAIKGARMARKAKRTKKFNPASRMVAKLNKK